MLSLRRSFHSHGWDKLDGTGIRGFRSILVQWNLYAPEKKDCFCSDSWSTDWNDTSGIRLGVRRRSSSGSADIGRRLLLFHLADSAFLASSLRFWEGLRERRIPFSHPDLHRGSTQKDSLCVELRHGCGMFDDSPVRPGNFSSCSRGVLRCGILVGVEGIYAFKESGPRISSSAHFQLHQHIRVSGNVPHYSGSPTIIALCFLRKDIGTILSWLRHVRIANFKLQIENSNLKSKICNLKNFCSALP